MDEAKKTGSKSIAVAFWAFFVIILLCHVLGKVLCIHHSLEDPSAKTLSKAVIDAILKRFFEDSYKV